MQAVAPGTARTRNLHRAGGRFRVTFVHARLRALDTAGALGRTGSLSRAALVVMFLQELAYQLLAPPVQFPFEFALAHLSGFAGGEEGFGIREDSIGRRAWEIDAGDSGSRLLHVDCTSSESCRHSHRRSPFPRYRTGTPRHCPGGSAPEEDRRVPASSSGRAVARKEGDGALAERCHPSKRTEEGVPSDINPYE